jgi:hypothetical protein
MGPWSCQPVTMASVDNWDLGHQLSTLASHGDRRSDDHATTLPVSPLPTLLVLSAALPPH